MAFWEALPGLVLMGLALGVALALPCALGAWWLAQASRAVADGAARVWSLKLGGLAGYAGAFMGVLVLGGPSPEAHSLLAPLGFLGAGAGAWVGTRLSERQLRLGQS